MTEELTTLTPPQARNRIRVRKVGEQFLSGIWAGGEGEALPPGRGWVGLFHPEGEVILTIHLPWKSIHQSDHLY